jgi:hypothetical protein
VWSLAAGAVENLLSNDTYVTKYNKILSPVKESGIVLL